MCGRYGYSIKNKKDFYDRFSIQNDFWGLSSHYNIGPGTYNPVIIKKKENTIQNMYWGLIPNWVQDRKKSFRTINARIEDIDKKPSFKLPFKTRRCLIPASFYYEWKKDIKPSIPYLFKLKDDEYFVFAGIYDIWLNPKTNREIMSYTIITCPANDLVKNIHTRMPVVLRKDNEEKWIDPNIQDQKKLFSLLQSRTVEEMECYQVSRQIGSTRLDNKDLISKAIDEGQTSLF